MVFKTTLFLAALACAGTCSPLPGPGSTTVCESTPNLLNYGLGISPLSLNLLPVPAAKTTVVETPSIQYGIAPLAPIASGSTTVCESTQNLPAPYVAPIFDPSYLQYYTPNIQSTVCETTPNLYGLAPYGLPYGLPRPLLSSLGLL